jgi:hypothetical protein
MTATSDGYVYVFMYLYLYLSLLPIQMYSNSFIRINYQGCRDASVRLFYASTAGRDG